MSNLAHTPGPWRVSTIGLMNDGALPVSSDQGQIARVSAQADFPRGQGHNSECAERDANARLIAAAPDLYSGGEAQTAIIHRAQAILTQYLIPDGIDGPEAINQLLGLLDGPDQRTAQAAWDAALAKARGQA